jgi:hypothetical protein
MRRLVNRRGIHLKDGRLMLNQQLLLLQQKVHQHQLPLLLLPRPHPGKK